MGIETLVTALSLQEVYKKSTRKFRRTAYRILEKQNSGSRSKLRNFSATPTSFPKRAVLKKQDDRDSSFIDLFSNCLGITMQLQGFYDAIALKLQCNCLETAS